MAQLTALHNVKNKTIIGGGVAGIGLGTLLIAVAPKITSDASVVYFLQLISPTVSIVGAYVTKLIIGYIKTYFQVWAASRVEQVITGFLRNPELSPVHIQNLKNKREEMQIKQLEAMQEGLLNEVVRPERVTNKSPKKVKMLS